jgi:hypothetical protein
MRPSGLTALAILNFVFGGFQSIGVLVSLASLGCTVTANGTVVRAAPTAAALIFIGLDLLAAASLFVAGAGFIRVHRHVGRWAANAYVLFAAAAIIGRLLPFAGGQGSPALFAVLSLFYPLLVALYANVVFRDLWRSPKKAAVPLPAGTRGREVPHVLLIAQSSIRQVLRSASGVLFILGVWGAGLLAAQILFVPVSLIQAQAVAQGAQMSLGDIMRSLNAFLLPLLTQLLAAAPGGATEGWPEYLLLERPGFLSLLFLIFSFVVPAIVAFIGSGRISSDTRSKGLRFLLLRTTRGELFSGKLMGSMIVAAMALLALVLGTVAHLQLRIALYDLTPVVLWGLWGLAAFVILAFPYMSLSLAFSGMIDSPVGAFFSTVGVMAGIPALGIALTRVWAPLGYIAYAVPYRVALLLFHKSPLIVGIAALAVVGYGCIYAVLGYLVFKRRDL